MKAFILKKIGVIRNKFTNLRINLTNHLNFWNSYVYLCHNRQKNFGLKFPLLADRDLYYKTKITRCSADEITETI